MDTDQSQDTQKQARIAALNLLARREQSRLELKQKLTQRGFSYQTVENCLERLKQQGLQSDQRFGSSYIQQRYQKGYGPNRIKQELVQKGIASQLQYELLQQQNLDWFVSAQRLLSKRARPLSVDADFKSRQQLKAKHYRYLQYRGFEQDQIQHAIESWLALEAVDEAWAELN